MAYGLKYTLSFLSDRGSDYRIEILAKDYQGAPIAKKMGVAPVLNIAQGDGCIQGTSLTFAVQADVDGELQEFYTTDNKKFQVLLYRNGAIMWQGYLLPELYSETYVAPPYDVSLTATDQLATLKDIEYSREDEQVLLQTVLEYLLSHTQLSLPLSYHMQLSMSVGRPMLENVYINQSAYNGSNCYDVLNAILLSMNCRIMQLGNQWLVTSATDSSENYYTERNLEVRPHKTLGQMYVADVYPNGTLGLVNSPALKGATLEYNHIFKKSILKNADCESRVGWEYISHSSDDGRLPGEITSFGKIFKAYCWQLMPKNIQKDASLHLWQDVEMPADDGVTWSLSFKHLFSTNAKLLLLAITHWDDRGVQRRLTGEGWVTQWDNSNVNSYIQVTGTPKGASLAEYSDIEQYEMSTVQFTLPPSNGTLRIGFINSTANYADPLAFAPIYVTQVYFTLGAVSGSAATTTIEPNATMGQEGVVLVMGDDVDSSNAVNVALNTLRRYDGGAIAGWMIGDRQFSSYFSMMLQEYSRYFGQKKRQLQGTIMGVDVLANIYKETYSNTVYRLVSADYNLLADEVNVTLEEVLSNFVQFTEQIFATNNSNSFGSPTSEGSFSGGSSSVDTSQLLRRDEAAETYATKAALADVNKEITDINNDLDALNELLNSDVSGVINTWGEIVDFLDEYNESQDLASILSQMNSDIANRVHYDDFEKLQEAVDANYGAIQTLQGRVGIAEGTINSHTADIAANTKAITAIDNRVDALEALGFVLKDGYIYTEKTIVSKGEIISGRRASGTSTDVGGGGGISSVTAQMIADALGYVPYSSANPAGYINSSALNGYAKLTDIPSLSGYATEQYVTSRGYITGISSKMVTDALGYTPYNSANFTKANIKSTLGIADWALAASKPSYSWSEITGKPTFATVATSGKYSDLSGVPSSLPASDVYTWAKAATKPSYTASEVGALSTGGGTITGRMNIKLDGYPFIAYYNSSTLYGFIGFSDVGVPSVYNGASWNTLIHTGNIGSQSVNSARKLYYIGAVPSSGFDANTALSGGGRMSNYASGGWWGSTMPAMSYGTIYQLQGHDTNNDLAGQLAWDVNHRGADSTRNLWWRANDDTNFLNAKWHQIAFTDSNVASADYATSAGNADTLDNLHSSNFARSRGSDILPTDINHLGYGYQDNGWNIYGPALTFGVSGFYAKIQKAYNSNTLYLGGYDQNLGELGWREFAFTDSNVASATKLQTARTIWGQSFDGSANVSGVLTLPANHQLQWVNSNSMIYGNGSNITISNTGNLTIATSGNVLIGTTTDNGNKLQINGGIHCDHIIRYDSNAGYLFGSRNTALGLTDGGALVYAYGNTPISMYTNGLERMRVLGNGNVLIGTTTDEGYRLNVNGGGIRTSGNLTLYTGVINWLNDAANYSIQIKDDGQAYYKAYYGHHFYADGVERLRVGAGGNIIVGKGAYISATDASDTARGILELTTSQSRFIIGYGVASAGYDASLQGNNIEFAYGTSHRVGMKITSAGSILINTTADNGDRFQINGTINGTNYKLFNGTLNPRLELTDGTTTMYAQLYNSQMGIGPGSGKGIYITSGGNVLIGTNADSGNGAKLQVSGNLTATGEVISSRRASSSDRRLKNNITYLDTADCLAMVKRIRPAEWDWKDNGKHSMGFIAQDVEHLMPYAVTSVRDNMLGYKMNLQYDQFIALAIGGVQAVDSEVQQLKKEVKELKEKLAKYEHNGNYRN